MKQIKKIKVKATPKKVFSDELKSDKVDDILDAIKKENEEAQFIYNTYGTTVGLSFPDPKNTEYWMDKNKRILYIDREIDESIIDLIKWIMRWNEEDSVRKLKKDQRVPIRIIINSVGGHLVEAMAVANAISISETPVYGINIGECASAASLIYVHCHRRFAFPNSYFLLHQGCGGYYGSYRESLPHAEHWKALVEQTKEMYIKALNITDVDKFLQMFDNEWFLYTNVNADKDHSAIAYNLVTDICTDYNWKI